MSWIAILILIGFIVLCLVLLIPLIMIGRLYFEDKRQAQHAILRNFPILGKFRYITEKAGPELRQYLYDHDNSGKPFSREDFLHVVLPGKYKNNMIGYGSKRDFEASGYFISNDLF